MADAGALLNPMQFKPPDAGAGEIERSDPSDLQRGGLHARGTSLAFDVRPIPWRAEPDRGDTLRRGPDAIELHNAFGSSLAFTALGAAPPELGRQLPVQTAFRHVVPGLASTRHSATEDASAIEVDGHRALAAPDSLRHRSEDDSRVRASLAIHSSVHTGLRTSIASPMRPAMVRPYPSEWLEEGEQLDQARQEFLQFTTGIDLSGPNATWSQQATSRMVVHHAMSPVPAHNDLFPLRDPDAPCEAPHPLFASQDGQCHHNVVVRSIDVAHGYRMSFTSICNANGIPAAQARASIVRDAARELTRLISGLPHEQWPCVSRLLTHADLAPHEDALVGQYGVFLRPTTQGDFATLRNGRIVGFYTGAYITTPRELATVERTHPDFLRYAITVDSRGSHPKHLSALGCANDLAFVNTALLPSIPGQPPAYAAGRINAEFLPFDVCLTDRNGCERTVRMMALVALDGAQTAELRVHYGDNYLQQFNTFTNVPGRGDRPRQRIKVEAEPATANSLPLSAGDGRRFPWQLSSPPDSP